MRMLAGVGLQIERAGRSGLQASPADLACKSHAPASHADLQRASSGFNVTRTLGSAKLAQIWNRLQFEQAKVTSGDINEMRAMMRNSALFNGSVSQITLRVDRLFNTKASKQWPTPPPSSHSVRATEGVACNAAPVAQRSDAVPSSYVVHCRELGPVGKCFALRQQPRHCTNSQSQQGWVAPGQPFSLP